MTLYGFNQRFEKYAIVADGEMRISEDLKQSRVAKACRKSVYNS